MKTILNRAFLFLLGSSLILTACDDNGNSGPAPVEGSIATDIAANVNTTFSPSAPASDVVGDTDNDPGYTFYDLDTGSIIDDTLSADWDIAFGQTTILANSGNGGGIQIVETAYAELLEAPTVGYGESISGSGSWYDYTAEIPNLPPHAILVKPGKTIIVQTTDGRYAKLEMLSYYQGNPDTSTPEFASFFTRPASSYFTFNYLIQSTSSTQLYNEDAFTFYDFETASIVEDSLSSQWDIGLNGTTIIANEAGQGGVQMLNIPFAELAEAPTDGYSGSVSGWYTYTGEAPTGPKHAILPTEGVTLVFQTGDGKFAKVRIMSYYQGNPDPSSDAFINIVTRPSSRYYTFEFAVQTDGSRFFE